MFKLFFLILVFNIMQNCNVIYRFGFKLSINTCSFKKRIKQYYNQLQPLAKFREEVGCFSSPSDLKLAHSKFVCDYVLKMFVFV